jgi:hypothetical protein
MDAIDEIGRRAARAALADAERYADVETGLARILGGEELEPATMPPRRRWVVLAAAAAVVAAGTAGIVWSQRDSSSPTVPGTTPDPTPVPTTIAPTTVAPTTVAPTTAPSTTAPSSQVATLAEEIGASKLIVREPDRVIVFRDGATTEVATPDAAYVETDGTFLWWDIYNGEPTNRSAAATLDGTVVCELEGSIHRIRVDPDGGYIASVERPSPAPDGSETPVPNFAVDCETGEEQPIDPVSWTREGGSRHVERIAERTFTFDGDAEGNADVTNESGVSINGDDYGGYYEFSPDASRVVYGDMTAAIHVTNLLRSRDTTTGELLWTAELESPVAGFHWYDDRIVASVPGGGVPGVAHEAVIVLDARNGDVITTVPTSTDIAFVE